MYAFIEDVPADEAMYRQVKERLPEQPDGLLSHVVLVREEGGLRYVDVWESEAKWLAFRDAHVEPAVGAVLASYGLPHDESLVQFQEVTAIDVMRGA